MALALVPRLLASLASSVLRGHGLEVGWRDHLRLVVPVAGPALAAAALVLAAERALRG